MEDYSTYLHSQYQADLEICKQYLFEYGSNYAAATKLFAKRQREATTIFYAFVRYPDELVDNPDQQHPGQTHRSLQEFITEWSDVVEQGPVSNTHPIIRAAYYFFKHYEIPFDYPKDFLNAMHQDLSKERYHSYKELVGYMWGSASTVGHAMTYVLAYKNKRAFEHAQALAEAMQLANFLRDIDEDYQERGRIYLPQQDMMVFGVDEDMIARQEMTDELRNLVKHYVERADGLFRKGNKGIKLLRSGQFQVYFASVRYRHYLSIIKSRNYDVFSSKIRLGLWNKVFVFLYAVISFPFTVR